MFLLVYFQWLYLLYLFVFACLLILSGLKVKNYLKINMLIIKMAAKSLKIKNDSQLLKINLFQKFILMKDILQS